MRATPAKQTPTRPRQGQPTARRRGGAPPPRPEERERGAGGPQDTALYVCRCGAAFQASVTASVRCPHCGDPQAW